MMYPGMLDMVPEPPISATARMYLRIAGYLGVAFAIYYYGDMLDMPEAITLI